ncbi:MAG: energy-coupling factor transporter transmembrane component T [Candidatus Latescibacterota bacterium]|nr:energy-coupling factor transporter transmembrane component T [Candidatus Latescibacterota bacterium]
MAFSSDITLGRYIARDSVVHRLDPRTKLASCGSLMLIALSSHSAKGLVYFVCFLALTIYLAKLPLGAVLSNLRAFVWLLTFTFGLHTFLTPGTTVWELPLIHANATIEGIQKGGFFSLRLCAMVVASALLTLTTAPMEITAGLEKLFSPLRYFRVPVAELALVISIALRFIPILVEEAENLRKAQLSRGADFGGNPIQRARSLLPLLVPLFISAFDRADRLALAMESRGYEPGAPRTQFKPLNFCTNDKIAFLITAVICGSILVIQ